MMGHEQDMKADIGTGVDRGEELGLMDPMRLAEGSRHRPTLGDLAVELAAASAGFRRSLPAGVVKALAELVRAMNCYYSNLIEGHDTHPIDIERAMRNDYSADPRTRNLQLEARAHVAVQGWIDQGGVEGRAVTVEAVREIHERFGQLLPPELLSAGDPETGEEKKVVPGEFRHRDIKVGRHIPVSPGAVPRFLQRFENAYSGLGKSETILAAAAAHHRLLWIHPFLDGNGRVARLMSHAMLLDTLETGGIWSVARGLARSEAAYKGHLMACDQERRNDLDGRGALSEEALAAFTQFFLDTCLDQVQFMEQLVQPGRLRGRILQWADEEVQADKLPARAGQVLEAVLYRGELSRGDVAGLLGTTDRHARRVVASLAERGVVSAESRRAPLVLVFPAALASRWMPGLFSDQPTAYPTSPVQPLDTDL
jgi:Fic family protein